MGIGSNTIAPIVKQSGQYPHYLAFSDGRIFSLYSNAFLQPVECKSTGYLQVTLSENGVHEMKHVHRFIAETLVEGRSESKNVVNHIDENKLNNRAENLEWVDAKTNINHGTAIARRVNTAGTENLRKSVEHARSFRLRKVRNTDTGEVFDSIADAARAYNVSSNSNIASACTGRYKTCAGQHWEFYKEVG